MVWQIHRPLAEAKGACRHGLDGVRGFSFHRQRDRYLLRKVLSEILHEARVGEAALGFKMFCFDRTLISQDGSLAQNEYTQLCAVGNRI
jgi:hypothetical protein